jgi:aryl-alcohol dehydrogenase-like predicted oxidoreductase
LHCWLADGVLAGDALRVEGKIDSIGVSIRDYRPGDGVDLAKLGLVDSIQVAFNLFEQRPPGDLFKAGEATPTAFVCLMYFSSRLEACDAFELISERVGH